MKNFISRTNFGENYIWGQRSIPAENTPPFSDWIRKLPPPDVTGIQRQGGSFSQTAVAAAKTRRE